MNRYAHATYCDDIRHELGGKLTLVGVYSTDLLVPAFPAVLPKLCLIVHVVTPADRPFQQLKIRVQMDEASVAEGELSPEDLRLALDSVASSGEDMPADVEHRMELTAHFVISPLKLDGPGVIRVRVETEDGEIKANGLRVGQVAALAGNIPLS